MPHLRIVHNRPPSRWDRFKDAVRSYTVSGLTAKDLDRWVGLGGRTDAGVTVSESSALTYAAVWQAVSLIAGDVGSLPLHLYKRLENGGKERYTAHPLYGILHDAPNPEMSSMVWRETLQAHLLTWGNAYAEIERDASGRIVALWPLLPTQVTPYRDGQVLRYRVSGYSGRADVLFEARDILHVPGLGFDGVCGYGVIRQARESLGLLAASEKFGASFFGNGSTFGGVLSHPKALGDKAKKNLRESTEAMHRGVDKAHRFLILEEGMSYSKLGVDPNDAQFLETREFQITEVARWFNLPPSKLRQMKDSSVRANIEQEALDYVVSTLRPWLVRWEQEMKRKLISPLERNTQHIEFSVEGLLRGDIASRYAAYAVGRQWGWLCADEIRERENLNPLPDGSGKVYLSPMNMTPADRLDEVVDAQVKPEPAPQPAPTPAPASDTSSEDNRALLARVEAQATTIGELQARHDVQQAAYAALQAERDGLVAAAAAREADMLAAQRRASDVSEAHEAEREAWQTTRAALESDLTAEREAHAKSQAMADSLVAQTERDTATIKEMGARIESLADDLQRSLTEAATERDAREQAETRATLSAATAEKLAQDAAAAAEGRMQAEAKQLDAERIAAEALARAEAAEAIQAQAEATRDAAMQTLADRLGAVITANRAAVVDTVTRLVAHEADKARKQQQSPAKLRAWVRTFYPTYEQVCTDRLTPVMAAHLALLGSTENPAEAARALAQDLIRDAQTQLDAAAELADTDDLGATLAQVTERWERSRPDAVADRLMRAEIAHVRSLR